MKKLLFPVLCFLLSGCAHQVLLVPRDGGPPGIGSVPATVVRSNGQMTIKLDGKTYAGTWVYVPSGGSIGFGSGTALSGSASATVTTSSLNMGAEGGGSAFLRAVDGSTLRCRFNYSIMSDTGVGECQSDKGRMFDLQIHD